MNALLAYSIPPKMVTVTCKGCHREILEQPWMVVASYGNHGPYCKNCALINTASVFDEKCRCDDTQLNGNDHCPICLCEQYEERAEHKGNLHLMNALRTLEIVQRKKIEDLETSIATKRKEVAELRAEVAVMQATVDKWLGRK